ncbi:hypothetical protein, partial [Shinella sumterensis]|uniref:hypothetical protein n=1 Tax=Shinella sumterensis TaxID=1967501 RepID=UPI001AD994A6
LAHPKASHSPHSNKQTRGQVLPLELEEAVSVLLLSQALEGGTSEFVVRRRHSDSISAIKV